MNTKTIERLKEYLKDMNGLVSDLERRSPGCDCLKANDNAICDHDVEAVRDDIRILQTWNIRKVQILAGVLASENVYQKLIAQLNSEQAELLRLHDCLTVMSLMYDPETFNDPAELVLLHEKISEAFELTM